MSTPNEAEHPSGSTEELYDRFFSTGVWGDEFLYGPVHRHQRRLIRKILQGLTFSSVLDVGCAGGINLAFLARHFPVRKLVGVDISGEAIHLARRTIEGIQFEQLNIEKTHLPKRFDLVMCLEVLEHIVDDLSALRNLRKMTGRWILVTTPLGRMRAFESTIGHVRNYTRGEMEKKLESSGFKVRRKIEWGFPFYSPLHRNLCNWLASTGVNAGRFGFVRRRFGDLLYLFMLLNSHSKGDQLVVLAEAV